MVIYKITNLKNNKIYIGQDTKNNPNYFGSGDLIKRAVKKHGKENFKRDVLHICETREQLNYFEKFYINQLMSTNKDVGYNISFGGTDGTMKNRTHTIDSKLKISNSHKGKKLKEETKRKLRDWNLGKKRSDEIKKKMSDNSPFKGKKMGPLSDEVKEKIRKKMLGKKCTDETKLNMSKSRLGNKNGFFGKKHTEEFMEKRRKKIIQLSLDNEVIKIWNSITEASEHLGLFVGNINKVLKGVYKTSGGFKFIYKQ